MAVDQLSATFAALADPTRRAILARLASGEATVTELAEPFDMSLPGISKHLKVLERAGLITRGRTAQWRPCRLEAGPMEDAVAWLNRYQRFWSEQLDRLAAFVEEQPCPPNPGPSPPPATAPRPNLAPASRSGAGSRRRRRRSTPRGPSRRK
jgi:DNA-binding transcriptional ArsR family regulator